MEFMTQGKMAAARNRLLTRATQTLLGICTGLVADGKLCDDEIHFLHTWLLENRETTASWPGNVIATRVQAILADGVITERERQDLTHTLQHLTGNDFADTGSAAPVAPATPPGLPVDNSAQIIFDGAVFCCTGKFIHGSRAACHRDIESAGGMVADTLTMSVDYLVIGALVSDQWVFESYGRKIEKAAALREKHGKPVIVSEQRWAAALCAKVASS